MKTSRPLAFLSAFATCLLSAGGAPLTATDLTRDVVPLIENNTLQALSIGVLQPTGPASAHAGQLAPDRAFPPDDRTLYEIGSISKVFTSLLLADAVVRGEVTLDTPVARLLPVDVTLPDDAGERITLRMLATHTSGLPRIPVEIPADNYVNPYAGYTEDDLWLTLRRVRLDFEPGTRAGYSNLAAGLLGTLLARHAGTTYAELLAARITGPLGMKDTVIDADEALRSRLAPPFAAGGEAWSNWDFKALAGAGGIRSTLADMMRFASAMLHPADTPLHKAIELAWDRQALAAGAASISPGGQALGWMLAGDGQTRWHNGMTGGYHAAIFAHREHGIAVVLLSNRSNPAGTRIAESLFRRAVGTPERPVPNSDRAEISLTEEQLDRCVGTFRLHANAVLVCERRNRALYVTPPGQSSDRLYAATPSTFFSRRAPVEIAFELPPDGAPATAVVVKQGSREMCATRE